MSATIASSTPSPAFLSVPRVSMNDIARAAGVHRSTVSLALRNQPRIPAATRDRIAAIAQTLGYAPDPMLDAFNFYRLAKRPPRGGAVIAFVSDFASREKLLASALHTAVYEGAKTRADELGFKIDLLFSSDEPRNGARLNRVLQARNITGVIAGALDYRTSQIAIDWSRYCAMAIESFQLSPPMDSITSDHRASTRAQVRRLRAAGHTRIGFVTTENENVRLQNQPLSGYLLEQTRTHAPAIPPLVIEPDKRGPQFRAWLKKHRPTGLVAGCMPTLAAVQSGGFGELAKVNWCGPSPDSAHAESASLLAQYHSMGVRAVEFLVLRQQTNQRGLPDYRTSIILPWEAAEESP